MSRTIAICSLMLIATSATAQELSKAETMELISATVAQMNAQLPKYAASDWKQEAIDRAIRMALDLRDRLAGNPYVRVSAVSIGIPAGISLELSFPEPDK